MKFSSASQKKILVAMICTLALSGAVGIFRLIGPWDCFQENNFQVKYPLIDFSRNFISQKHYFGTLQPLRNDLEDLIKREKQKGINISFYLEFFNTGANISINNEKRFLPASLVKLPLVMAVMKKIQDGDWSLNQEFELFSNDVNLKSGDLYKQPVGSRFSAEFLAKITLLESDNTAYNILLRNLGNDALDDLIKYLGLDELFNEINEMSSKEFSRFFRSLYTANFLNVENSQKILEWLAEAEFKEFLSSGLPEGVVFSHKFGRNEGYRIFHDSGIVYVPNRPYLITVFIHPTVASKDADIEEVERIMKEISSKSYKYISEYQNK